MAHVYRKLLAFASVACVTCAQVPQQISIDWSASLRALTTQPAYQVVVNPLITRESPVHDQVFQSIRALSANASNLGPIRFVPWLPYPRLGVAELEPPSGSALCGFRSSDDGAVPLNLTCGPGGGVISSVDFASYGTPTGWCGGLKLGACNAASSAAVVAAACVGKQSCVVVSDNDFFGGDPCVNTQKSLAVQVTCSVAGHNHTYWDFTNIDPLMEDFFAATGNSVNGTRGSDVIINFSTPPTWLYATPDRVPYPDDPLGETWSYEQGTQLVDPTARAFGEYYGRLLAWYAEGGFTDEYGQFHSSGYHYNISHWECLNEVEAEHANTPQSYTVIYDAMVQAMQQMAPRATRTMKFVGLALEGHYEWNWYNYFLNASNHANDIPIDYVSFHFYASAASRTDPSTYSSFFTDADTFVQEVAQVMALRDAVNPKVKLDVDECGVILPNDNDPAAPQFPLIYWNAAAAMYAYLYGQLALLGLDVLGESQLVGYPNLPAYNWPPQFPSVAMLNWTTGAGTARYWVLKLLADNTAQGDTIVEATVANGISNPFCGETPNLANLALACESGVINKINFASYGTPTGSCPSYSVNSTCNAANSTAIVESYCLGQQSCIVPATTPVFGDPCYGTFKYLKVVASCSSGGGYSPTDATLFVQAYQSTHGARKLLLVNKSINGTSVSLPTGTGNGATWTFVDESTADGPPAVQLLSGDVITLNPWAVGFVLFA